MLQTSLMDKLPPIPETFRGMFNVMTEMLSFLNGKNMVSPILTLLYLFSKCYVFAEFRFFLSFLQ